MDTTTNYVIIGMFFSILGYTIYDIIKLTRSKKKKEVVAVVKDKPLSQDSIKKINEMFNWDEKPTNNNLEDFYLKTIQELEKTAYYNSIFTAQLQTLIIRLVETRNSGFLDQKPIYDRIISNLENMDKNFNYIEQTAAIVTETTINKLADEGFKEVNDILNRIRTK